MLVAASCRKAVLNAQASAAVSGGTSRVLLRPGMEALAITATPQERGGGAARRKGLVISTAFDFREEAPLATANGVRRSGTAIYVGQHKLAVSPVAESFEI